MNALLFRKQMKGLIECVKKISLFVHNEEKSGNESSSAQPSQPVSASSDCSNREPRRKITERAP
jgi:hypothetical protein